MTPKEFILAYEGYSMRVERDYKNQVQIMRVIRAIGFGIMKVGGMKRIKDEKKLISLPFDNEKKKYGSVNVSVEELKNRLGRKIKQ